MAVFRRNRASYRLKYELAPGVTYSDHGRDLLYRLNKENQLCSTKGLVYNRPNIFALSLWVRLGCGLQDCTKTIN